MRLQINKRLFSLGDKYDITDEADNVVYQAQGHLFTLGNRLDLFDGTGQLVARIQQRLLSLVSEYDILRGDEIIAVVKQDMFRLLHQRFTIEGSAGVYEMEGDWLNWNYEIRTNGQRVAQIRYEFSVFQERYGMEIIEGADTPLLLCLAIVMDEVSRPKD